MILSHDEETIVARCTPSGSGALALIRLSGTQSIAIADKLAQLASKKRLADLPTHTIHYGFVVDATGAKVDQVLFLLMRGPQTFTGQDTVEITCHNNPFLIEEIINQALSHGARPAQEGEFTRRSVVNNKIDLIQAEAINELITAQTQHALKKSLATLEGSFSHYLVALEKELLKAMAFCEASFEFIDEEMEFGDRIAIIIKDVLRQINTLKKTFDQQQQIKQGIRIALIGAVNAGKSSLFNSLLGKDRAIVTPIAGTTRDAIEAGIYAHGTYMTLVDTAGLRQTDDIVEQEGIKKSFAQSQEADIIILVFDGARIQTAQEEAVYEKIVADHAKKIIYVRTKSDLPQQPIAILHDRNCIEISNTTKTNIAHLERALHEKIAALFAGLDSPYLLNARQFNLLVALEKKLNDILVMLVHPVQYELVSYHLNDAIAHLAELTGKSISEASMDMVFREFCVGK